MVDRDLLATVTEALKAVEDPCSGRFEGGWSIIDMGLLTAVREDDEVLTVELTLTDPLCPFLEHIDELVSDSVSRATGHPNVVVDVSADIAWEPSRLNPNGPSLVRRP